MGGGVKYWRGDGRRGLDSVGRGDTQGLPNFCAMVESYALTTNEYYCEWVGHQFLGGIFTVQQCMHTACEPC